MGYIISQEWLKTIRPNGKQRPLAISLLADIVCRRFPGSFSRMGCLPMVGRMPEGHKHTERRTNKHNIYIHGGAVHAGHGSFVEKHAIEESANTD